MTVAPLIVTDSTCDLAPALYAQYDIQLVPLHVLFGEESYRSGIDMDLPQFVERLNRGDHHPSTSQPTVGDFVKIFESLVEQGRPILSIHVSTGLSGTFNAAHQAAQQLMQSKPELSITVWDSQTISAALGFQVLAAARAAAAGHSVEEILPLLESMRREADFLFTLDDLSYLVRGGRIGQVQYRMGQVLNIKPIITVSKAGETLGTYITAGRARSLDKTVEAFVKIMVNQVGEGAKIRAMAFHGIGKSIDLAAKLEARVRESFDCVFYETAYSTPVLGVHVGPLALDIGFVAGEWDV
ncbi:MAG: DegV family protein [Anaerolineae bacterium]|nr:DegV family protein [Anaerolineae bacterium]